MRRYGLALAGLLSLALIVVPVIGAGVNGAGAEPLFADNFEHDLDGWELHGAGGAQIGDSGDDEHQQVLILRPQGDVLVLVRGSENWGGLQFEGEVLFPTDEDNYLGVAYNVRRQGDRTDFGLIYIKGNGSYLTVNPHRDLNVGRTLYPEYHVALEGEPSILIGEWKQFKAEIIGSTCHFYVGNMVTPQLIFSLLELESGAVGLQPRSVGGDVWVDNIVVTSLDRFSYDGLPRPELYYEPWALLTDWRVMGPLERSADDLARRPTASNHQWQAFDTDARGAVITGRVIDYHGPRSVAYFRTLINANKGGLATLSLSTVDDLALWVNGKFHAFTPRQELAWYDFWKNPEHQGRQIPVTLAAGQNVIVLRVRGGVYASGGFFAHLQPPR